MFAHQLRASLVVAVFALLIGATVAYGAVPYSDVQAVFQNRGCVNCHGGSGGLNLASNVSYTNLFLVTANGNNTKFRVKPFDANNSYLKIHTVDTNHQSIALTANEQNTFINWINEGASTSYTVTPSSITAVAGSNVGITAQLKNMNGANVSLSGVTVTWSKTGGGSFTSATSNTDANGVATVTFTAGLSANTNQVVYATTSAAIGNTGNIAITPGPAAKYLVTPSSANALPGTMVMITAQLVDANNNAISTAGLTVTWSSTNGGSFVAPTSQTNASGIATINFTVSTTVGTTHMITATDNNALTGTSSNIRVNAQGSVDLVSAKPDGSVATGFHYNDTPNTISADGRFMLFVSNATDLTADPDTNTKSDIYVRDLQSGTTKLVTVNAAGTGAGDGDVSPSYPAVISANGRYVAFASTSTNLVGTAPSAKMHVYRRDLQTNTTILVSADSNGTSGNNDSDAPQISADGRYICFMSNATNLTSTTDNNAASDVFWHDCETGVTLLVSINSAGTATGSQASTLPVMSSDGKYVAFASDATDLVASDTNNSTDVFRRDMFTNSASSTVCASARNGLTVPGDAQSTRPAINSTGQFVTFDSTSTNLVANDSNGKQDIFRRDCDNNVTICVSATNGTATPGTGGSDFGPAPMSADGRYVVFSSDKTNLVSNDSNASQDVFRRDCNTNETILISAVNGSTTAVSLGGKNGRISADGRFVTFETSSSNVTAEPYVAGYQIYRRDTVTNTTLLLSISLDSTTGNGDSQYSVMSADGTRVGFSSYANTLVSVNTGFALNVFAISVNSIPQVGALSDATSNEGAVFTQNGSVTDVDSLDTFTAMVDYGDGSGLQALTMNGSNFTLQHTYADNGAYTINISVTDNHGGTGTGTQKVRVSNVAPTVAIQNAPATGIVGSTINLTASVTEPGTSDTLTYAWTVTKDGAVYAVGSAATFSFTPDAAATYAVGLTVTDKDGGSNSANASITVPAPDGFSGSPTTLTDSTPAAGATSFLWDFGDGTSTVMTMVPTVNHVYAAPGIYTVTLTETDGNGNQTVKTFTVTVGGATNSLDNDGDGFPDELESGVGALPMDATSTPFNIPGPVTATNLTSPKTSIKLNLLKTASDSISVSGLIPVTAGFAVANSNVAVDVGGAVEYFTLDNKGGAKKGKSSVKASIAKGTTSAKFKATLKGTYAAEFTDEGLSGTTNAKNEMRSVTIYIVFANTLYKATPTLKYSAKAGKSANAKF